ncbi:TrbM/KikA/MpfK family conjugal transfer protein [Bordetella sp. FB-8]|uniref:TrbM/KikA/MpfK family conjugal transfer protein n=1 Tax=Bordetella sp. FB-8 TaxID=1159870 RepID=UPI0003A1EA68|nr:TrbM/KikA/MpfK family conjugal transfer protein [Bordetella sp. FB-8]
MKKIFGIFPPRVLISYLGIVSTLLIYLPASAQSHDSSNSSISVYLLSSAPAIPDDEKLPCEALLCLSSSSGSSMSQCDPAISAFNSIHDKYWSDTFQDRLNWLKKCPTVSNDQNMTNLAVAIVNGSAGCDAATLNRTLFRTTGQGGDAGNFTTYIDNNMPAYCQDYASNPYIQQGGADLPVYVGTPDTGGFWTDRANLQAAQAQYQAKLAAMQAAEQAAARQNGGN